MSGPAYAVLGALLLLAAMAAAVASDPSAARVYRDSLAYREGRVIGRSEVRRVLLRQRRFSKGRRHGR